MVISGQSKPHPCPFGRTFPPILAHVSVASVRTSAGSLNSVFAQIEIARAPCLSACLIASEDGVVKLGVNGLQEASKNTKARYVMARHRGNEIDRKIINRIPPMMPVQRLDSSII
jgi:hypothetical protein